MSDHFPSKDALVAFITSADTAIGKREIARAFSIKGQDKITLKRVLKEMEQDGLIGRQEGSKRYGKASSLPDSMMADIVRFSRDGDLIAFPVDDKEKFPIYLFPSGRFKPSLGIGDRVLVKVTREKDGTAIGKALKRLPRELEKILGRYEVTESGDGLLQPIQRGSDPLAVPKHKSLNARTGDLVLATALPMRKRYGMRPATVLEIVGDADTPKAASLIAVHKHGIPTAFSDEALALAEKSLPPVLGNRVDLTGLDLVTIDGEDARDFDDAVFAEETENGFHLIVAIADVAHYVKEGSALDKDAYSRSTSVYFPDRVVPMLPETLSNGLCSLMPHEDRACMVVHMYIDKRGHKIKHKFERALMRSSARLTYLQVQNAIEGRTDEVTKPLLESRIKPLYAAYEALKEARVRRQTLELNRSEFKVSLDKKGRVSHIGIAPQYASHKLIEEFMVLANVAAAESLEKKRAAVMYRVHEPPPEEKRESLSDFLKSLDIALPKGAGLKPMHLNKIMEQFKDTAKEQLISDVVLRSQSQARYRPDNAGHFGLALSRYAHFTSPIRRYADLLVHRSLIHTLDPQDKDGLSKGKKGDFPDMGEHISDNEQRAVKAERDATERYLAAYMSEKIGATFSARISAVKRFGLFITLTENGADGLVPMHSLTDDFYMLDEKRQRLIGERTNKKLNLGDEVTVILKESSPVTGGMVFTLKGMEERGRKPHRFKGKPKKTGKGKRNGKKSGRRPKR